MSWAPPPQRVLRLWRTMLGDHRAFEPGGRVLVTGSTGVCPPGWVGVVRLGDGVAIELGSADERTAQVLEQLDDPSDPLEVTARLDPPETVGPGVLAYLPDGAPPADVPVPVGLRTGVEPVDGIRPWLATLPVDDVAESSVGVTGEVVVGRTDGEPAAAACHLDWPTDIAHVGVVVAPEHRGRGIGAAVARAAIERAHEFGKVVQWRAAAWNAASRALASRLGLVEVGRQFSFRLPSAGRWQPS